MYNKDRPGLASGRLYIGLSSAASVLKVNELHRVVMLVYLANQAL